MQQVLTDPIVFVITIIMVTTIGFIGLAVIGWDKGVVPAPRPRISGSIVLKTFYHCCLAYSEPLWVSILERRRHSEAALTHSNFRSRHLTSRHSLWRQPARLWFELS